MAYLSFLLFLSIAQANEDIEDIRVFIKGMVCSFCVQGVEKQFKKQDSVEKVEVDLEDSLVSIWLKEDQKISDDTINSLIKDSGYDVESIEHISKSKEPPKEQEQPSTESPKKANPTK